MTNIKVVVNLEKVTRRLLGAGGELPSHLGDLVDEGVRAAYGLLAPKASYIDLEVESVGGGRSQLSGGIALEGKSAEKFLSDCSCATLFVATIGSELEAEVERRFSCGDEAGGLILDTIGSEATESLARRVQLIVHDRAKMEGFATTARFSPGYGDLDLSTQRRIVEITQASRIDVSLTEGFMLIPRKSVSAIVGWRKG